MTDFLSKVFDVNFCTALMRQIDNIKLKDSDNYELFFTPMIILETIFKITLDF